jgi:pyruvate/2-oxoglutarate dehydrogenase complex dihydrolipoamide dehydrogenase (E3) component
MSERYDLIAVGGGAAGLVSAAGAAGLGARSALIEHERMGGECLWTGCVPSKALIAAGRAAADARAARRFGVNVADVTIDFSAVMRHVHQAQQRIAPHDSPERFRGLGVDVVEGTARFLDASTLEVAGRRLRARNIVLATGSRPRIPPLAGIETVPYLTNENVFLLESLPARLLVLGAGPVGLELAQAFARLGSRVTLVEQGDTLLPREDAELAALLAESVAAEGVELLLGTRADRCSYLNGVVTLEISTAGATATLHGDALLVATGRRPNLDTVDAAAAGIDVSDAGVIVDDRLRTSAAGVWAAGDVVAGTPRFTHVADYHARLVLRNALFPLSGRADYRVVPWVTYTDPELAHVGLTEAEAREQHGSGVQVYRREFGQVDRAIADGRTAGMLKLVADRRGNVLGGHVLGYGASSVIAGIALAMKNGIRLGGVASTVHAYPTYPEAFKHAADAAARARLSGTTQKLVKWIVRH